LAYVKQGSDVKSNPGGAQGLADVPPEFEDAVIEASEECPGECIFIHKD
jgi:ferredoxin